MKIPEVIDDPSARDLSEIDDCLNRYNADKTGIVDARYLTIVMRSDAGDLPYTDDRLHKSKEPFDISGARASMHTDPAYSKTDFHEDLKPH